MKPSELKTFLVFLFFLVIVSGLNAQVPEMFNYQAVARDNTTGEPLQNTELSVRIAILSSVQPDVIVWEEEHLVTSNEFGLFILNVGDINAIQVSGSVAGFSSIDWTSGSYYLRPSVMPSGGSWSVLTPAKLITVPFAMLAKDSETKQQLTKSGDFIILSEGGSVDLSEYSDPDQSISLTGNTLSLTDGGSVSLGAYVNQFEVNNDTLFRLDGSLVVGAAEAGRSKLAVVSSDDDSEDALFEVKRADGQTVFAVYPEAVRMYVAKGDPQVKAPGTRGGFAVAGFDRDKATPLNDLLWLTPDSVRFYIDDTQTGKAPGTRGGFAVAGFDSEKGLAQDYIAVTSDSTRIFTDGQSGFSVTDISGASDSDYMIITSTNSFIGLESGFSNTLGSHNTFIGTKSGYTNENGSSNVFIGEESGLSTVSGSYNVFMGAFSGHQNQTGSDNVFLGNRTGNNNTSGHSNVFLGTNTGYSNTIGSFNTFLGRGAGQYAVGLETWENQHNTFIGFQAGYNNQAGIYNVAIGSGAGQNNHGNENVSIGYNAGLLNDTGSKNVFIGNYAGRANKGNNNIFIGNNAGNFDSGDWQLYIENSNADKTQALIWGDFGADDLRLNANIGIMTEPEAGLALNINGLVQAENVSVISDERYKSDIHTINNGLDKVLAMRGVSYYWNTNNHPEMFLSSGLQMGVIAQEIEEIIPELVFTNSQGMKSVSYTKIIPVLVEAIKDQNSIINEKESRLIELEQENAVIKARLDVLESAVNSLLGK